MLGPSGIDPVCKVTVSTIQHLYSQLSGNATFDDEADEHSGYEIAGATAGKDPLEVRYNPKIPIESFDFVIIDDFKACYTGRDSRPAGPKSSPQATKSADRAGLPYQRKETERFRKFTYEEIIARDKANLDILWLKDDSLEDSENLPAPALLAAEIVESLEAALEEFRAVEEALSVSQAG
jgi:hypothetical protein